MPNFLLTGTNTHLGKVFDKMTPAFGDAAATRESNNLRAGQPRNTPAGPPTQNTTESWAQWGKRNMKAGTAALGHQWLAAGVPRFLGEMAAEGAKIALDTGDPKAVAVGLAAITTMNIARNIKMWHAYATRSESGTRADNNAFAGLHGNDPADDAKRVQAGKHRFRCLALATAGTVLPNVIGFAGAYAGLDKVAASKLGEFGAFLARTCAHVSVRNAIYANGRDLMQSEFSFVDAGGDPQTMHEMRATALMYAIGQFGTGMAMDAASVALTGKNMEEALGLSKTELMVVRSLVRAMLNATPEGPDLNANLAVMGEKTAQRMALDPPRIQELTPEQVRVLNNPAHGVSLTAAQNAWLTAQHQGHNPGPLAGGDALTQQQAGALAKSYLQHAAASGPTISGPNIFKCSNLQTAAHKFFEQSITREALLNTLVIALSAADYGLSKTKHFADSADTSGILQGMNTGRSAAVNGMAMLFFALAYTHVGAIWQSFGPSRTKEEQPRFQVPALEAELAQERTAHGALQTTHANLTTAHTTLQTAHTTLTAQRNQLQTDLQTARDNLTQAQRNLTNAHPLLTQRLNTAQKKVEDLENEVSQLLSLVVSGEEDLKKAQTQVTDRTTERDTARQDAADRTTERDTARQAVTDLTTQLTTARQQLTDRQTELTTAQQAVTDLTTERDGLKQELTKAQKTVRDTQTQLDGVQSQLETAETRITVMEPELTAAKKEIATLRSRPTPSPERGMTPADLRLMRSSSLTLPRHTAGESSTAARITELPDDEPTSPAPPSRPTSPGQPHYRSLLEGVPDPAPKSPKPRPDETT